MNERIQEMIKQANLWQPTHNHKTWVRDEYIVSPGELEKFAELIVKQCAHIARNTDLEDVEGGDDAVLQAAGLQIERHFGGK